ncbi:hypothetical protein ES708_13813 [subsurface metagenome]
MIAFRIDLTLFSIPCEKNATVIGIIGNTHGVKRPAKPASMEKRKNPHKCLPDFSLVSEDCKAILSDCFDGSPERSICGLKNSFSLSFCSFIEVVPCPSSWPISAKDEPCITNSKSDSFGGRHFSSSQLMNSTNPLILTVPSERSFIFCLKTAL